MIPNATVNLDGLLQRYFGTTDLSQASASVREAGIEKILVDLGLEIDRSGRFALWSLLYMLGRAPEVEATFDQPEDRDAARNLIDLLEQTKDR